ncbi:MAG: twin-arginine translocase subunit TatC [Deltaproteobacteria bacterium]|nr:twin-arginine translocase subunit TatC [Deltaproteobacteria bacterium]
MIRPDERVPFTSHLVELRNRLIVCLVAIGIGFSISYYFYKDIFDLLARPLVQAMPPGSTLVYTGIVEAFFTYLKVSLLAGVILASPVIIYEIWAFITPGLYEHERPWIIPVVFFSTLFFASGVVFGYYVVFPVAFEYFLSFATDTIRPLPSMREYFSFVIRFLLAFGLVFELPVFIFFLARFGIVDAHMLSAYRKYSVLLIFIAAAILTPTPDIISQFLMAGPMLVLYEVGVIVARVFGKKKPTDI